MGLGCVLDKWVKAIQVELGFSSFFAIKTLKNHHNSVKIFNGVFQFALNQTFPEQKKNPTWVLICIVCRIHLRDDNEHDAIT